MEAALGAPSSTPVWERVRGLPLRLAPLLRNETQAPMMAHCLLGRVLPLGGAMLGPPQPCFSLGLLRRQELAP